MLAVIRVAGQQYNVQEGQTLFVPHITGNVGDNIKLEVLLSYVDGTLNLGKESTCKVEILDQLKGDKVIAYKQKRRKGFRKKKGHRTHYTKIKVTGL